MLEPTIAHAESDGEVELVTGRQLARLTYADVDCKAFPELKLKRGALVTVFGRSGAGKSTLVTRAIDSIPGTALLLSIEEPGGPTLAARNVRIGATREDLLICSRASVDQLVGLCRKHKVASLAIDSFQRASFSPRDLRHILSTIPSIEVLFVTSQINAANELRGGHELAHESDCVIEVRDLVWTVATKSRYAPVGTTGPVLNEKKDVTPDAA